MCFYTYDFYALCGHERVVCRDWCESAIQRNTIAELHAANPQMTTTAFHDDLSYAWLSSQAEAASASATAINPCPSLPTPTAVGKPRLPEKAKVKRGGGKKAAEIRRKSVLASIFADRSTRRRARTPSPAKSASRGSSPGRSIYTARSEAGSDVFFTPPTSPPRSGETSTMASQSSSVVPQPAVSVLRPQAPVFVPAAHESRRVSEREVVVHSTVCEVVVFTSKTDWLERNCALCVKYDRA